VCVTESERERVRERERFTKRERVPILIGGKSGVGLKDLITCVGVGVYIHTIQNYMCTCVWVGDALDLTQ